MRTIWLARAAGGILLATLVACGGGGGGGGGGGSSSSGGSTGTTASYRVGGTVSGLTGTGLVLQNNGGNNLSVSSDGIFLFSTALANGANFAVSVKTQPGSPSQICTVNDGSGTIAGASVTNIKVICSTNSYKVGGTVSGLAGSGLVLQDNGGDDLTLGSNGSFSFATPVASGANYAVSVKTQPNSVPAQICKVAGGSGTVSSGNVGTVAVSCGLPTPRYAYVANSGSANVSAYTVSASSGALAANGAAIAAGTNPSSIAIAPGGKFVYVANRSAPTGVSAYAIDAASGVLTAVSGSPFAVGTQPISIAIAPNGKFAYVANLASGNNIDVLAVNTTTGALTVTSTAAAGASPQSIAVDPSGKFVYVANNGDDNVSAYTINASTGALTSIGTVGAGTGPFSIAVDPTGKFAYVANFTDNNISAYTIDATTGALTAVGSAIAAGTNPQALAIDPSGKFVYAANNGSNNVSAYAINTTTGALTTVSGAPFTTVSGSSPMSGPSAITIAPDDKFAYVTNFNGGTVSVFGIDATTGALTGGTTAATTGTLPAAIAILGQ